MKYLVTTDNGWIEVDDDSFDPDAKEFFTDQKNKGHTLPIEFRYSFDKLIKRIKKSVQNITDFTVVVWHIGSDNMPEGNEPDEEGLLNVITDIRLKGRSIPKIEIAGTPAYAGFLHNPSNQEDNKLDLTPLGGARIGEYVIAYLS